MLTVSKVRTKAKEKRKRTGTQATYDTDFPP